MEINENKYKILSIFLLIAIIGLVVFVIIPKYRPVPPEQKSENIDFSTAAWIEDYVEDTIGLFGKDFFLNTAFSYNQRSNKMVVTYASQRSVEEARNHYLAIPGAEQNGRNDETSLNITAEKKGQPFRIYNYYSSISRVFELELTLGPEMAEQVITQLENAFPAQDLARINEIHDLTAGDVFGGYVRYRYDDLDGFSYPYLPIFSRAYLYGGTQEDFTAAMLEMNMAYPDFKYDSTQSTTYYNINGQIISVSYFVTDSNETVVSISIQAQEKPSS